MFKNHIQLSLLFIILSVSLTATPSPKVTDNSAYVQRFHRIAVKEMHRTGIPASIKLAQAILESGGGNSDLAKEANNHFGIKCGSDWKGDTHHKKDDDRNRIGMKVESCFRAYASPEESFIAHSEFLKNPAKQARYGFLFNYDKTDYESWAEGLKKAGYATNPKYPELLIQVINENDLQQYDYWLPSDVEGEILAFANPNPKSKKETTPAARPTQKENTPIPKAQFPAKKEPTPTKKPTVEQERVAPTKPKIEVAEEKSSPQEAAVFLSNDVRTVAAPKGNTLAKIAKDNDVELSKLLEYNDLETDATVKEGDFIYLQPKRKSYRGKKSYHMVYGESMHRISQLYGLKLDELYEKNLMKKGEEPANGQRIHLKSKRKTAPKLKAAAGTKTSPSIAKVEVKPENEPVKKEINLPSVKLPSVKLPSITLPNSHQKHVVQAGETLYRISKQYDVAVDDIVQWNNLQTNTLEVGQELIIKKK